MPSRINRSAQVTEMVYQGIKLLIDGPQGEVKEGTGVDGKPYRVVRTVPYGFVAPMAIEASTPLMVKGDDKEDFDAYVGPDAVASRVRIATQLHARNGHHNELKAIFGCDTDAAAKTILATHVAPRMVGRIGSLTVDAFKAQLSAYAASPGAGKVAFQPETDEDIAELAAVQAVADSEMMGDALKASDFPGPGDNRAINLKSSRFKRFDREAATKLESAQPELWAKGGPAKRDVFAVLCRAAATGGGCRTRAEIAALRLREAWASKHAADTSLAGTVAAVKYLVVLSMGEDEMKATLARAAGDDANVVSGEPSSEQPPTDSGAESSGGDSVEEAAGADGQKAKRRRVRTMTPAVIPPLDHRSEDPGDTGPLSLRSPSRSAMPETITHDKFTSLVRNCAALGVAAGTLSQRSTAGLLGFLARTPDTGLPQRKEASPGAPAGAPAAGAGSNAPPVARTVDTPRELALHLDRKSLDEEAREVWFCASSAAVDSYSEIVDQNEWNFTRWDTNPVILWAHESYNFPIGKGIDRKVEAGKLWIKVRFSKKNPVAILAWDLVVEDMLRAVSVGFRSAEMIDEIIDGVRRTVLKKNTLYELSLCSIPANPEALIDVKRFAALEARLVRDLGATFQRAGLAPDLTHFRGAGDASFIAKLTEQLASIEAALANLKTPAPVVIASPESPPAVTPATTTARTSGETSMKLRSLISLAALLPVLRDTGELTLTGEDGTPIQLHAPGLKSFVVELESKAAKLETDLAAEKTATATALDKAKTAEDKAKQLLADLTKSELDPLVGVDLHCLSPADRDDLAIVRAADETLYQRQLASVKARHAKGVEALKAAGGGTGGTNTDATKGAKVEDILPTKNADPAPPTTAATIHELDADAAAAPDPLTEKLKARAAALAKERAANR